MTDSERIYAVDATTFESLKNDPSFETVKTTLDDYFKNLVDRGMVAIDKRVEQSFERVIEQFQPGDEQEGIGDS